MVDVGAYYSVQDFNDIIFSMKSIDATAEVMTIFKLLEKHVGLDSTEYHPKNANTIKPSNHVFDTAKKYQQPTHFSRPNSRDSSHKTSNQYGSNKDSNKDSNKESGADWVNIRSYKTTQMNETVGIDKYIGDIRIALNKLSNKNYDAPRDAIVECIRNIMHISACDSNNNSEQERKESVDNMKRIAQTIFDISSSNKFFSEIYAKLYKELINNMYDVLMTDNQNIFRTILSDFILKYIDTFNNIKYIEPQTDYDGFCEYTKQNDKRKAIASFISNLFIINVINQETVLVDCLKKILTISDKYMKIPSAANEVEEITESVFIFVSVCKSSIREEAYWNAEIFPVIQDIANKKANELPSLTNRTIFKYLDIVGLLHT